jgi:hypothetical protein
MVLCATYPLGACSHRIASTASLTEGMGEVLVIQSVGKG